MHPTNSLCAKPLLIKQPSDYNLTSQDKNTPTGQHTCLFCLEIIIYLVKSMHKQSDVSTALSFDSD